jgi:hypothetical protein
MIRRKRFSRFTMAAALATATAIGGGATAAYAVGIQIGGEKYPKVMKPVAYQPGTDAAGDAARYLWVSKPGGAKGVRRVIIPFFQVQYVTKGQASAGNDKMSSSTIMRLSGVDGAQMQAMTDAVYAHFVGQLKSAGYEVVSLEAARAYPAWRDLQSGKTSGEKAGSKKGYEAIVTAPTGMTWSLLPTSSPEFNSGGLFGSYSFIGLGKKEQALMDQSGAAILGFRAVVDFAEVDSSKSWGGGWASSKGKAGLALRPVASQMYLLSANAKPSFNDVSGRQRYALQTPLILPPRSIKAVDNTTTTGQKAGMIVGALFGQANSVKQWDVAVDPALYQTDVTGALNGLADMYVARMRADGAS